ncbi:sigma-70 family RNA polymerase sigma factor [Arthrobacter sp. Hz1]
MEQAEVFQCERARLVSVATRVLDDRHEAEDIVQQTWFRLDNSAAEIENLPAWLTKVTTRLCVDRLRARVPAPHEFQETFATLAGDRGGPRNLGHDPVESVEQRESVGQALRVVVDRLTPNERVALVLHESFAYDFDTIGEILGRTPAATRKLASRARAKVANVQRGGPVTDGRVVDAFMAAARGSNLIRLLALLAPGASVRADAAAIASGTPQQIEGQEAVARFFNGSAHAALPVFVNGRPGAAWFHRGRPMVAFDFAVVDGAIESIVFRAEPEVLAGIVRRTGLTVMPDMTGSVTG